MLCAFAGVLPLSRSHMTMQTGQVSRLSWMDMMNNYPTSGGGGLPVPVDE